MVHFRIGTNYKGELCRHDYNEMQIIYTYHSWVKKIRRSLKIIKLNIMLVTTYSYKRIVLNSNPHTLVIIIYVGTHTYYTSHGNTIHGCYKQIYNNMFKLLDVTVSFLST